MNSQKNCSKATHHIIWLYTDFGLIFSILCLLIATLDVFNKPQYAYKTLTCHKTPEQIWTLVFSIYNFRHESRKNDRYPMHHKKFLSSTESVSLANNVCHCSLKKKEAARKNWSFFNFNKRVWEVGQFWGCIFLQLLLPYSPSPTDR